MYYKWTKIPSHYNLVPVYLYSSSSPNEESISLLNDICSKKKLNLKIKQIPDTSTREQLFHEYLLCCLQFGCNKFAISDSVDILDSILLKNMAYHGITEMPNVIQNLEQGVALIRPFAYLSQYEINNFAVQNGFKNSPTSPQIHLPPQVEIAQKALYHLSEKNSDVLLNIYHSLYDVRRLYLGNGTGEIISQSDDNPNNII